MPPEVFLILLFLISVLSLIVVQLILRYRRQQLLHQERMAALDKGVAVPLSTPEPAAHPRVYLLRGLMWTLSSAGLIVCLLGLAWSDWTRSESASGMAYQARDLSRNLNIPLYEAKQIVEKDRQNRHSMPFSIALIGLVPLGVGIAYLVFYREEESRARAESPAARG